MSDPQPKDFINDTNLSQNRTSFLIEDILYRQKTEQAQNLEKTYDCSQSAAQYNKLKLESDKVYPQASKILEKRVPAEKSGYSYFQTNMVPGCVQGYQQHENGYIQVMGALGAYLGTPYKSMTDPYFLTQG
ncbi:hypothetical protein NQ314_017851 [Rhamnusium bicolor]|uniref:Uncharacterized protein n=1 Tax=Rhamnusium bicolor TaxID=1586634 RepID=A0AAV8WUQ9_9CUCU|nr:hypothetical protein NQ314_017851 [Rhamnusium bicolor]